MSILKYLKRKGVETALPDLKKPLSNKVPSISIAEALKILNENQMKRLHTSMLHLSARPRYPMEHGASRKYSKELQQHLNESTVFSWVKTYRAE